LHRRPKHWRAIRAELAERALPEAWNEDARAALVGSLAAFQGDVTGARAIFDADQESET
jgi:hypothetical protein